MGKECRIISGSVLEKEEVSVQTIELNNEEIKSLTISRFNFFIV